MNKVKVWQVNHSVMILSISCYDVSMLFYLRECRSKWIWASTDVTWDFSVKSIACCLAFSTWASIHCLSLVPKLWITGICLWEWENLYASKFQKTKLCNKWSLQYILLSFGWPRNKRDPCTYTFLRINYYFNTRVRIILQEYHAIHTWIEAAAVQIHVHAVTFPNLLHCKQTSYRCTIASNKSEILHRNKTYDFYHAAVITLTAQGYEHFRQKKIAYENKYHIVWKLPRNMFDVSSRLTHEHFDLPSSATKRYGPWHDSR